MSVVKPDPNAIAQEHASIDIAAPPHLVYALVSDIERMGEWSPEAVGGRWLDGGTGNVGDWFEGQNQSGERRWTRKCEVAEAAPGDGFTFVVGGVATNCTWWSYEMTPTVTGTHLTERWWIVNKSPALVQASAEQYAARIRRTQEMLPATLAGLKAAAEAEAGMS